MSAREYICDGFVRVHEWCWDVMIAFTGVFVGVAAMRCDAMRGDIRYIYNYIYIYLSTSLSLFFFPC